MLQFSIRDLKYLTIGNRWKNEFDKIGQMGGLKREDLSFFNIVKYKRCIEK